MLLHLGQCRFMRDGLNCCEKQALMSVPTTYQPNDVAVVSSYGGVLVLSLVGLMCTHGQGTKHSLKDDHQHQMVDGTILITLC